MGKTRQLRRLLSKKEIIVAPGAYDALSARMIEDAGFPVIHATGAGISCVYGHPDVGLLTATEVLQQVERMASATAVPIVADVDNGYGNPINVFRTIRDFERAGVAGVHIEDQVAPKKCGLLDGREVVSRDEMTAKIRAALDARVDPDFVIIARTDARASKSFDEVVQRVRAYAEAGADMAFAYGLESVDEMRRLPGMVSIPLMTHVSPGGPTDGLSASELAEMGYRLVIFALSPLEAAAYTMRRFLADLKRSGDDGPWRERMLPYRELYDTVGLSSIEAMQHKYRTER